MTKALKHPVSTKDPLKTSICEGIRWLSEDEVKTISGYGALGKNCYGK